MNNATQETTKSTIRTLSSEAAEHGDLDMVAICDRALEGDAEALAECAKAIRNARAQSFDARHEVRNAIGESIRDMKIAVVTATTERELSELRTEATRAAEEEGGGKSDRGYWHGAPGNGWRISVEVAS